MKNLPTLLSAAFKKDGKATCFLVKIVSLTGETFGFTNLDKLIVYNDGLSEVSYNPNEELSPLNIESTSKMEIDNTKLEGWFQDEFERLLLGGKLFGSEITVYRVCYQNLDLGHELVIYGTLGRAEYAEAKQGSRKLEFRSLFQKLKQRTNDSYSLTCRATFGDNKCKMPFVWEAGTISEIDDQFLRFKITGVSHPDEYFSLGVIEFTSGDNESATLEVERWFSDGWLNLSFSTPYAVQIGDTIRIRKDCNKTESACLAYGNIINMRAEHLTPVQDKSLSVPGAYVKSRNAL